MTKKNVWICDICKEEFDEERGGYKTNISMEIVIPSASGFEMKTKYSFDDTCLWCRDKFRSAIGELIDDA